MNVSILKLSKGDKVQFPTAEEPIYILDYPFEPLDARGLTGTVTCLEETDTNFFLALQLDESVKDIDDEEYENSVHFSAFKKSDEWVTESYGDINLIVEVVVS
jgi:hypothetical protein